MTWLCPAFNPALPLAPFLHDTPLLAPPLPLSMATTPYPTELQSRVVAAVDQAELTLAEIASVFSVGLTFVKKMLRLQRAGEDLTPRHGGGPPPRLQEPERALLREAVVQQPDVTLTEWQARLAKQRRCRVSVPTICRAL